MLSSGLPDDDVVPADAAAGRARRVDAVALAVDVFAIEGVEPPGLAGPPTVVGCSDGTREGFRDCVLWPNIAGCAGGFGHPGVVEPTGPKPMCGLMAGDSSADPWGSKCSAADLCSAGWHVCQDGVDVSNHSPTGCESCVLGNEPRFFLVASGASPTGICTSNPGATNDLHGCGGLGQPESAQCSPLARRMGFADCLATGNVWLCGLAEQSMREAAVVTKSGPTQGGVLCCRDL